ncbi:kinase-like domain-containing protein [Protomyces lactucae-debilis]|uniref:Kinase-like domain-containing protein n=1 Tax=Protomyces lactucae-debilis TaxID=2754530 RepID=A0A1Y2F2Q5_PROLT|nr:kinase-like domain-containing protein [Protomyces lactucae-debilis]ORY77764.1 kinase-like domain-containing protein [Protomyces lactucae-debilis]
MSQPSSRPVTAATWRPWGPDATPSSPATGTPYSYSQQALTASSAGKRKRDETHLLQPAQRTYPQQAVPAVTRRLATPPAVQEEPTRFVDINKGRPVALRKEYSAQWEALGASSFDDPEGHYVIVPNAPLTKRYKIIRLLGQGTFGKVVQAYDHVNRIFVAIKIIRAVQKYRDASMIELRVLRTLYQRDPNNWNNCIHLRDCFDYRNHVCIVTDLLGESIFDFLKGNDFAPFPRQHIQDFARQLFKSVMFLHFANLIHTDLKPENILLVSNEYHLEPWRGRTANIVTRKVLENSDIRLIDFGSATFEDEYHSTVVSTRHYRAPEIILGMGWSYPCDIWSIGCILLELFTGDALFQTHDNLEHLAMMDIVCGPMDGRIVRQSSKLAQKMFRSNGRLDYPNKETTKDSRKFVKQMKPLAEMLPRRSSIFCEQFGKLLQEIFVYDPARRITAKKALAHPFFQIDPNM